MSEVLITLLIIGVIAAITIPIVVNNVRKHQTEARIKKFISTLSGAIHRAEIDSGDFVISTSIANVPGIRGNYNGRTVPPISSQWWNQVLGKYMPVTEIAGDYKVETIGSSDGVVTFNPVLMLNDGSIILHYGRSGSHSMKIYYDTNGQKGPNEIGRDIFPFEVHEYSHEASKIHYAKVCYALHQECFDWEFENHGVTKVSDS